MFAALERFELPPPVSVEPVGKPGLHAVYRLGFRDARVASILLRRVIYCPGWHTLETELAAVVLVQGLPGVPVAREFQLLDPRLLGYDAALVSDLPGRSGAALIAENPATAPIVATRLGEIREALDQLQFSGSAMRGAGDLGFLPLRASWPEEWFAFHHMWTGCIHRHATGLGALSAALDARVVDRLDCLHTADTWTLVHRDLHPGNILLSASADGPVLTGVVDWAGAMVADPVVEWMQPLQMPDAWLAAFVAALGPDRTAELLCPEPLARLGVYHLTRCLARLALAAMPPNLGYQGRTRALAMEVARQYCIDALDEHHVRIRLQAALDATVRSEGSSLRVPDLTHLVLRRGLERTRFVPAPVGRDATLLAGAWALALGSGPGSERHGLGLAWRLLDVTSRMVVEECGEPIADRVSWRAALVDQCMASAAADRGSTTLLWLGLEAIDVLDESVSDAVLRGLEGAVQARLGHERHSDAVAPAGAVLVGCLAWLAARLHFGPARWESQAERVHQEVADALDILDPFPTGDVQALPAVESWPPSGWAPGTEDEGRLPVAFLSLHRLAAPASNLDCSRIWDRLAG